MINDIPAELLRLVPELVLFIVFAVFCWKMGELISSFIDKQNKVFLEELKSAREDYRKSLERMEASFTRDLKELGEKLAEAINGVSERVSKIENKMETKKTR